MSKPAGRSAAWLARLLWEQEVASSNLAAPTVIFGPRVSSKLPGPRQSRRRNPPAIHP